MNGGSRDDRAFLSRVFPACPLLALVCAAMPAVWAGLPHPPAPLTVPQCNGVTLRASYLAEERPGKGSGFLLTLQNNTPTAVTIPQTMPLSIHWYAEDKGHWLWRSSSGDGGMLVDAFRERGRLFAAETSSGSNETVLKTRTIAPGEGYTWSITSSENPALRYRPGCEHCSFADEHEFRAVLAYAYLPPHAPAGMLHCGLRSAPVTMPPLAETQNLHNSTAR